MPTARSVHGIANGRWEHPEPRLPKALTLARIGVAKVLKTLSDRLVEAPEVARMERAEIQSDSRHAAE